MSDGRGVGGSTKDLVLLGRARYLTNLDNNSVSLLQNTI